MNDISDVRTFMKSFNINNDIVDIYITLITYGPLSVSAIARLSGVQRNKIYRMKNELLNSKLITVDSGPNQRLRAASSSVIREILDNRLRQVTDLYGSLTKITKIIDSRNS